MKNRISTEIIDSILRSLGTHGLTRTKIMYGVYLSYSQVNAYLSLLIEKHLIIHERETGRYKITHEGIQFLKSLDELRVMVGEMERTALEYPGLSDARSLLITQ
jgi:predicted transcriptional regulator